jgi:uncharacterized protein YxeA
MKKFLLGIIALIVLVMIVGAFWDLDVQKDKQLAKYQKEIADRNMKIQELDDSIRILSDRVEIYEITFDALREVDSATVDKVFHMIWNVREEQ